jgi:hypothetical protein
MVNEKISIAAHAIAIGMVAALVLAGTAMGGIPQDINGGTLQAQIYPVSVPAGGTSTITFTMVTSGTQTESATINGKVVDTGSLKESPFSFNYKMEAPRQCNEGETYSFGVVGDGKGGWTCASILCLIQVINQRLGLGQSLLALG